MCLISHRDVIKLQDRESRSTTRWPTAGENTRKLRPVFYVPEIKLKETVKT